MRRRILEQIFSGFGMTAASMTAKPTLFPIASTFGVTRTRPVGTFCNLHLSGTRIETIRAWKVSCGTPNGVISDFNL